MILNELSMDCGGKTIVEVNGAMSKFLQVCHEISNKRNDKDFYYTIDFLESKFIKGYGIFDWLKDSDASHKEKAYLRTIINRKQIIDNRQYMGSEMTVNVNGIEENAMGCLAAYEADECVVSMSTNSCWDDEIIVAKYISVSEETQELYEKEVEVGNCSCLEHVEHLVEEERELEVRMVSSGTELWEKRESIYPHLVFCDSVKKQLLNVNNSLQVKMIKKRLGILEKYFATYEGNFKKEDMGYGCREESESVANSKALRGMRTFVSPYGREEFFSWHISFAGDFPGRIHFLPDAEHKVGIIGYVGKHLPTSRYSTI